MAVDFSRRIVARWTDPAPEHVPLLKRAGIQAVVLSAPHEGFARACQAEGVATLTADELQFIDAKTLTAPATGKPVVCTEGLWPGVQRPSGDSETASASGHPWVDSNVFWFAYLRALFPERFPVLGYVPDTGERIVPFTSHELALEEAWLSGGNYLLAFDPRFREALLKGDAKAVAAWDELGRAARWVGQHATLFRRPAVPVITLLVEPGEATAELANLMYRHSACPALEPAARPPAPDPSRRLVLVAVDLKPPQPDARNRILAHAEAGATVVVNGDWWRTSRLKLARKDVDRDFYTLGRGQVIAYKEAIADPGEFTFDVIDVITHQRRAARLWNATAAVALASGEGVLRCLNYGHPVDDHVQARIQGTWSKATLLRPESAPVELKVSRRSSASEVVLPELNRCAVVVFG